LRLDLDPNRVDVFGVSREPGGAQTIAIRDKPRGPLTRLTIKEPVRPGPEGGWVLDWLRSPALIPQGDRRSFVLYHELVDAKGRDEPQGRFECFDPRSPGGRRWVLAASELRKATGEQFGSISPVSGLSRIAPSMVLAQSGATNSAAQWLVSVDTRTGKIERVTRLPKPAEKETRHGPILSPDGTRATYISVIERQNLRGGTAEPSNALVTIDAKSGAVLSRTPVTQRIGFSHDFVALDPQGRALLTTSRGLGRITPGKSESYEELFSLNPVGPAHAADRAKHPSQALSEVGLRALAGVRRLSTLVLSGFEVSDPMLVELGLNGLKTVEMHSTSGELNEIGRLTNVTTLVLNCDVGKSTIRQLAKLSALRGLEINLGFHASEDTLAQLGQLTNLTSLRVNGGFPGDLRWAGLQTLRNLTSLNLGNLWINDADLAALSRLEHLTQLDLRGEITVDGVRHLKNLPELVDLRLSLNRVGDANFDAIVTELAAFRHLRRLRLADENTLSAKVLGRLGKLESLTQLDLHEFGVDNGAEPVEGLAACQKLADLRLTNYGFTPADLRELLKIRNLKQLDLSDAERWEADPRDIGRVKSLEELNLFSDGPPYVRLTDACLAGFTGLTNLRSLCLSGNPISDAGLEHLSTLKSLKQLQLVRTRITDQGLRSASVIKQLEDLDLFDTAITDHGLEALENCDQLKALDLGMTQVTDTGMRFLARLKNLRRLSLRASSITDAGLKDLAPLGSLEELDLSATDITDAGLASLKGLKNLRRLDLTRTAITDAGLKELRELPELATMILGR
jgi:internalin A